MTIQPDPENRLVCPNCQALNAPRAIVCASCGIRMADFRSALPRLEKIKSSHAVRQREQLEDEKTLKIQETITSSQRSFRRLLLLFLVFMVIIGLIVTVVAVNYANRVKQSQAELKELYASSLTCLQEERYLCARNGFRTLIFAGADFPDLDDNLNQSQQGLAGQYFDSGQWESAIKELDDLLQRDPGNQAALDLLRNSYDRWIDQLGLEGKLIQEWMIRRERDARFPPTDE